MRDRLPRPVAVLHRYPAAVVVAVALAGCGAGGPSGSQRDRIAEVIDGDTVELRDGGRARLIGVDTPETFGTVGCWGPQASAWLKRRLRVGQRVTYSLGAEATDRYGRRLVYLSDRRGSVNLALIRFGHGRVLTIPPNDQYAEPFEAAQEKASSAKRGLWGRCGGA
jgi:micrococcal nuclease